MYKYTQTWKQAKVTNDNICTKENDMFIMYSIKVHQSGCVTTICETDKRSDKWNMIKSSDILIM